jgi:hypothetical protein
VITLADDGRNGHPARGKFLLPRRPLALLVRAKMRTALEKRRPDLVLPRAGWRKPWVFRCTPWGDGAEAVLRYLARYVFRVAITEARIVGLDDTGVTIRHKHRKSARWRTIRLDGPEFNLGQRLLDANRTIGQPEKITTIFGRRVTKHYRGKLQTEIEDLNLPNPVIRSHYRNGFVKQYVRDHLILRTEPASNNVNDYGVNKAVETSALCASASRPSPTTTSTSSRTSWRPSSTAGSCASSPSRPLPQPESAFPVSSSTTPDSSPSCTPSSASRTSQPAAPS